MADKKEASIVDFTVGYKFAFTGEHIRVQLFEKIKKIDKAVVDTLEVLSREIGEDPKKIATLMVSMLGDNGNEKVRYIVSLCTRVNDLMAESAALARIAKGMNDNIVYILAEKDMERFGL